MSARFKGILERKNNVALRLAFSFYRNDEPEDFDGATITAALSLPGRIIPLSSDDGTIVISGHQVSTDVPPATLKANPPGVYDFDMKAEWPDGRDRTLIGGKVQLTVGDAA